MTNLENKNKKISYSAISTYEQCAYKYRLTYIDKHYIQQSSIATDFGTLIHYIEETMLNILKEGKTIDYRYIMDLFYNIDLKEDNKRVLGVNKLKELYPEEYLTADKNGRTYKDKVDDYIDSGICRLEDYLTVNPNLEIIGAEIPFTLEYRNYIFQGSIDRVFRDKFTQEYFIEDIKTYGAPLDKKHLTTPLQFVIYSAALQKLFGENIIFNCKYDLPLCNCKQDAGTKGFMDRGLKKINSLLDSIEAKDFKPTPTALCHWCIFSKTYPNQPEEAKNLCPYFSHWTRENKDFSVENEWMGEENHAAILEAFINDYQSDRVLSEITIKPDNTRKLLIRR